MYDLIRDSTLGQIVRYLSRNKYLLYPDEIPGFEHPAYKSGYNAQQQESKEKEEGIIPTANTAGSSQTNVAATSRSSIGDEPNRTSTASSANITAVEGDIERDALPQNPVERLVTQQSQHAVEKSQSLVIQPTKTADGVILVDWYTTDDPENPANWSLRKKAFIAVQICIYTFTVYIGSSIYTGASGKIVGVFGVSVEAASLGLALYVLAYGTGPLLFSPLSEIPAIGRNPPYIITLLIFAILWVPASLVKNFGGLLALRFLTGFFGSPCLATGGASFQDIFPLTKVPYLLSVWTSAATLGPALGPVIANFSVQAEGWRWSQWEMLWLSAPVSLVLLFFLPETSSATILYRRAKRLQRVTGNMSYKSQSEIDQQNLSIGQIVNDALIKPVQINALDPAVLFSTFYTCLLYGIYYSFFECFPIVFTEFYHFSFSISSLPFLSVLVGLMIALPPYVAYWYWGVDKPVQRRGIAALGVAEDRLVPALFLCLAIPTGLFLFAWTARPSIHWIAPVVGIGICVVGMFIVLQCVFMFLAFTYPKYGASLFAANDFSRSTLAAGSIMFSRPMFLNLGVDWGVSLLAFFTVGCCVLLFTLWYWGAALRAKSRFAQ